MQNLKLTLKTSSLVFCCSCLGWLTWGQTSWGHTSRAREAVIFVPAKRQKPPSRGTPTTDRGTGSRGNCPYNRDLPPLTSLVGTQALTSTIDRHPSFWVYVPYSSQEITWGEFTLQDGEEDFYRARVSLPSNIPGIVEIKLPSHLASLQENKPYRWYFELNCAPLAQNSSGSTPSYATLTGKVELIQPSDRLKSELASARSTLERVKIFAKYGIWHDTLAELIRLRTQEPKNKAYQYMWYSLLRQPEVNKSQIGDRSFVGQVNNLSSNP